MLGIAKHSTRTIPSAKTPTSSREFAPATGSSSPARKHGSPRSPPDLLSQPSTHAVSCDSPEGALLMEAEEVASRLDAILGAEQRRAEKKRRRSKRAKRAAPEAGERPAHMRRGLSFKVGQSFKGGSGPGDGGAKFLALGSWLLSGGDSPAARRPESFSKSRSPSRTPGHSFIRSVSRRGRGGAASVLGPVAV